jgi:hypothetical protein
MQPVACVKVSYTWFVSGVASEMQRLLNEKLKNRPDTALDSKRVKAKNAK